MEEKLLQLYKECVSELKSIGINVEDNEVGEIDIKINSRSKKRYGCCKQEEPDRKFIKRVKKGRKISIECDKFKKHHIEISSWVMELDDKIIKNTIIHEMLHCIPYCNNHGPLFRKYADEINNKLGYDISRLGDKEADFEKSNLKYKEEKRKFKYKIVCTKCGEVYYRQRMTKNFTRRYRCGKCGGKLAI